MFFLWMTSLSLMASVMATLSPDEFDDPEDLPESGENTTDGERTGGEKAGLDGRGGPGTGIE